jgi:hypothetical protein
MSAPIGNKYGQSDPGPTNTTTTSANQLFAVTTQSVRWLPQFVHWNRRLTSGTSPRLAATRPYRSTRLALRGSVVHRQIGGMITYEVTATGPKGFQVTAVNADGPASIIGDFCE